MTYKLDAHDYNVKLSEAFIGLRNKVTGLIEPVYVMEAYNVETGPKLKVQKWKDGEWVNSSIPITDRAVLKFPTNGAVNLSSGLVIIFKRRQVKFWREMPHRENVIIIDPFREERTEINNFLSESYTENDTLRLNTNVSDSGIKHYQLMWDVFNNKYYTLGDAIQLVSSYERMAAAINKEWFIGLTKSSEAPILFRGVRAVGHIDGNKVVLPAKLDFLKEEAALMGNEVIIDG